MSQAISGLQGLTGQTGVGGQLGSDGKANGGGEFMKTLQDAMSEVGDLQSQADERVGQLITGNGQDVHSAMIAVEKASLAFEMMVQVRNKIVAAYTQVSGMQF